MVLRGWKLIRQAGDFETSFKFHHSVKIGPSATITVWSSDSGQTHGPPYNIVMKGKKWFVADSMRTSLLSNTGEVSSSTTDSWKFPYLPPSFPWESIFVN
jgi:lamin B